MLGVEIVDDLSKRDSFIFLEYSVGCENFKNEYQLFELDGWQLIIFSSRFSMLDSTVFKTYANRDCSILWLIAEGSISLLEWL